MSARSPLCDERAALLGLVQGPTELLPVSSSAHLRMIPWLAGWEHERLDDEERKAFEVAVHAGAAAALLIGQRRRIIAELRELDRRRAAVIALSLLPSAAVGLRWERTIEGRLGGPSATAAGLLVGSAAMVLADRVEQRRGAGEANGVDGLALGVAQAAALAPGVSRNGATLTAARARGFSRPHANLLSRTVALPVIAAASAHKALGRRRGGLSGDLRRAAAIGTAAAFASTLASQGLIKLVERDRALWPYAAYRTAFAGIILARLGRGRRRAAKGC